MTTRRETGLLLMPESHVEPDEPLPNGFTIGHIWGAGTAEVWKRPALASIG